MDEMKGFDTYDSEDEETTMALDENLERLRAVCAKQCMKLHVNTLHGKSHVLYMLSDSTVGALKETLMNYEGVLPESQRLSFEGKVLEDHQKMHTKHKHTNNDKQQQLIGRQHPEPLQHPERVHSAAGPK